MTEIFRYMSTAEKKYLENGTIVNNHTDWHELRGTASTSKGFTFGIGGLDMAIQRSRQLKGIVHADWLLVGEIPDELLESAFTKCVGRYVDWRAINPKYIPTDADLVPEEIVDELCIEKYSTDSFTTVEFLPIRGVDSFSHNFIIGARKMVRKKERDDLFACNNKSDYDRYKLAVAHGYERGIF